MAFDVTAVLKANVSNFTSGIKEAQSVFESFQSKSNRSFENISSGFQKTGTALTAGLTAPAIAGVAAIIKSYAGLEQAVGGVQTLFKNSMGDASSTVINNANKAFRTAGVSATKYMEQVSSFSATLLQGLGGDTAKAASYGDKAIVQMSDNANKMGTSIESLQYAYQGFAKDNFTMLDNLKLGYGGTQSEMARLVNESGVMGKSFKATAENVKDIPFYKLIEAIGVTQDRLGITGTTAKEASETVSGSFMAMKAAGMNLVAGLGDNNANIKTLMSNLEDTVITFAGNVGRVLKNIWNNLPMAEWQKWVAAIAVGAGPVLLALSGIMKGISTLKSVFQGIGAVMSNPFGLALVAIAALVAGLVYAYKQSETFRNIVNKAISSVVSTFNKLKTAAQPALDAIKQALSKLNIGAFTPLIAGVGLAIVALTKLKGVKIPNPLAGFKASPLKIPNPFSSLANMAKSAGEAVKNVFVGIGKSISNVFKGIGSGIGNAFRGLAMVNPGTMLAFSAAILAVGAAITMILTQSSGLTAFFTGLSTVITAVGSVITGFVSGVISALANAFVTIAPSLASLSPLVIAFGQAFATAAPFVTALGTVITNIVSIVTAALPGIISAISGLVSAFANGVAQIITAITPIVQIIGTTFTSVVQIIADAVVRIIQAIAPFLPAIAQTFAQIVTVVANAIVQIVQALAPFIPAITQMVQAVAPVLSQIVNAFNNLISQISPIIDSITNLFKTMGTQISSILNSASGVIESFGSAVRNILDGVAGIFESMGNAAKNAGTGVKLMAQGIQMLVDLKLGDLVATLAGTARGLAAIASSGIAGAGAGLQQAGSGIMQIAVASQMASMTVQSLPGAFTALSSSIVSLPASITTVSAALQSMVATTASVATSVLVAGAGFTVLNSMVAMVGSAAIAASAGMTILGSVAASTGARIVALASQLNSLSSITASAMSRVQSATTSSMNQMQNRVQSAFDNMQNTTRNSMNRMAQAVEQGGSQMASAMRSSGSQVINAVQSSMNQAVSAARSAAGSMQAAGAYIGQGLADGMRSALGAVTAAANELVAQAERAAQAKAKIHSPSRLFRDEVGYWIGAGIGVGVQKSAGLVMDSLGYIQDSVSAFNLDTSNLVDALAVSSSIDDLQAQLLSDMTLTATPSSVTHSINNQTQDSLLLAELRRNNELLEQGQTIVMDTGAIVGSTSDRMNQSLGNTTRIGGRFAF